MTEPARNEPIDDFLRRTLGDGKPTVEFPGRETAKLQDPTLAAEIARRLDAEPSPDGVVAPITHAIPTSTCPVEYVMHVWTHKCSVCNTEHKHSEIFALNHIRTGYRGVDGVTRPGSTFVRNMTPVSQLEWRVPIKVHHITTRVTAGCFECLDAIREEILPTLRSPPVPEAVLKSAAPAGASAPARTGKDKKSGPMTTNDFLV